VIGLVMIGVIVVIGAHGSKLRRTPISRQGSSLEHPTTRPDPRSANVMIVNGHSHRAQR
jgi:hypothetical protein